MALANGKSQVRCREITLHTETAIHIVEQFTNVRKNNLIILVMYNINANYNYILMHLID